MPSSQTLKENLQDFYRSHRADLELTPSEARAEIAQALDWVQLDASRLELFKRERLARKPLQHITGLAHFFGMKFTVSPSVLIPRPETETLVELALKLLSPIAAPRILEIGTGSGCISICLAHKLPLAKLVATDISLDALEVARRNAKDLGVAGQIEFVLADLVTPELAQQPFDLFISNPPYISTPELSALQPEVRREPSLALDGGIGGQDVYERLSLLSLNTKYMLLELDSGRAHETAKLFESLGECKLVSDLSGRTRFLSVERS